MRCIITGVETENKWKNKPISVAALRAAKKYQKIEPHLTMREALKKLDKDYFEMLKKNANKLRQPEEELGV